MTPSTSDWMMPNTQHGMLVAFGEFLQQHGLVERLMGVPIGQKRRVHTPQAKLIEFLVGIMSGIEYLRDFDDGPHPVAKDTLVARVWGQAGFAHYSGVSRTLQACDEQTVAAVEEAITAFSRPFIAEAIQSLLRRGQPIVYDLDLTGQAVSATSSAYPEVAFGWMDDGVKLGYQLARVCLSSPQQERIWLAGFHHPGDTVSVECLQELILAAEAQTQIRPRRRPELVQQCIEAQTQVVARIRRLISQQEEKRHKLQNTQATLIGKLYHAQQVMKEALPLSSRSRLSAQSEGWQARLPRLEAQLAKCQQVLRKHQERLQQQQAILETQQAWQAKLEADNRANPDPAPYVEVRMDAGFASGENLTWALEMGYCPNTKAMSSRTTDAVRASLPAQARWLRVGDNAEMIACGDHVLHGCPFPLPIALERFKVGQEYKYATLIHYRDDGLSPSLPSWFRHYNGRQTIEAGNKEMKGTFFVQHLMSRSLAGIRLQVLFTGLAANVVRWCRPWLKTCTAEPTPKWRRTLQSPKHLVRVAANTAALVHYSAFGMALQFAPESPFPGVILLLRGIPATQLALGFNRPCRIESG
jgi:hypothetical protein